MPNLGAAVRGRAEIVKFLGNNNFSIDSRIRKMARNDQSFLPEAATTSAAVSAQFLTSRKSGSKCLYHWNHDLQYFHREEESRKALGITGTVVAGKETPDEGHLNCGCPIDVAVLQFLYFKTWLLHVEGNDYGMAPGEMSPAGRLAITQAFDRVCGLNASNIFPQNPSQFAWPTLQHQRDLARLSARHAVQSYLRFEGSLGNGIKAIKEDLDYIMKLETSE